MVVGIWVSEKLNKRLISIYMCVHLLSRELASLIVIFIVLFSLLRGLWSGKFEYLVGLKFGKGETKYLALAVTRLAIVFLAF